MKRPFVTPKGFASSGPAGVCDAAEFTLSGDAFSRYRAEGATTLPADRLFG